MSKRLEVEEYLERVRPDMMILCETKWKDEWGVPNLGKGKYDVWMKNRKDKNGGGVMVLTEKSIRVEKVEVSEKKDRDCKISDVKCYWR